MRTSILSVLALGLAATGCSVATDDERAASSAADITADTTIGPVCMTDYDGPTHRLGVMYVGFCNGEIDRVDLVTGGKIKVGSYRPGETLVFEDVSPTHALWWSAPLTPSGATTRPPALVGLWDKALGGRSFDASRALSYPVTTSEPYFGALGYAGNGRVLAAWNQFRPRVGLIDTRTSQLTWQSEAPSLRPFSSSWHPTKIRSTAGDRWLLDSTFVEVAPAPRVVALSNTLRPVPLYTADGNYPAWDGKHTLVMREREYALVELESFVQYRLGTATENRPVAGSDGTTAYYTYTTVGTQRQRSLEVLRAGATESTSKRDVPATLGDIAYLAPRGTWAIALESIPTGVSGQRRTRAWMLDLVDTSAAPVQLAEGWRVNAADHAGVITLTTETSGHTLLRRIAADRTVGPEVDVTGVATMLSASRTLVNGCTATFDGAALTIDSTGCLAMEDRRYAPEVVDGKSRFVVRRATAAGTTLAIFRF